MTQAERQAYLRGMLTRYRDALHQGGLGPSLEGFDSRLLLLPREFNDAMRELDRCLTAMRYEAPALRFHVIGWHVDVHYRQVPRYLVVVTSGGKRRRIPAGFQLQPVRARTAREKDAEKGL